MQPENFYFGGGSTETVMHPAVLAAMALSALLILVVPRKKAVIPFLLCAFLIPMGQTLVLLGMHFYVLRVILLFAIARMVYTSFSSRTSIFGNGFGNLDKAFLLWAILRVSAVLMLLSFRSAVLANQGGFLLDVFGEFFFLRFLIHDDDDILRAVKLLAIIALIVGVCALNEKFRSQNVFGYLGGAPVIPQIRDGAIRAQGPFSHPILAGSFGATLVPLFFWLWQSAKSKLLAIVGVIGSTCIVVSSASSTPLMAYVGGVIALCLWPIRKYMRELRWGLVITLVGLHLVMKAPVWFLISRIDLTGASSGYHRAMLVNQFIRNFGEWWLVGTTSNANWGFDMWDTSNEFIAEGVLGGLATLICFIVLISMSFATIGTARKSVQGDRKQEWFLWCLGAALFSHVVAFWGISYFDHTQVAWFALLTMISAATAMRIPHAAKEPEATLASPRLTFPSAPAPSGIRRAKSNSYQTRSFQKHES